MLLKSTSPKERSTQSDMPSLSKCKTVSEEITHIIPAEPRGFDDAVGVTFLPDNPHLNKSNKRQS